MDHPIISADGHIDFPLLPENLWVENGGMVIPGQPLFEEVAAAAGVDDLAPEPFGETYPGYRSTSGCFPPTAT